MVAGSLAIAAEFRHTMHVNGSEFAALRCLAASRIDTVRENLRMAKPDATDEELHGICERTGVWKILSQKLPPSETGSILDANLAAGKTLSGGERKLLALTRCLLRDPSLLFLDEQTVGMDNEEKFEIRKMLREGHAARLSWSLITMLTGCSNFAITSSFSTKVRCRARDAEELLSHDGCFINFIWPQWDRRRRKLRPILHGSDQKRIASAGVKIVSIIERGNYEQFSTDHSKRSCWRNGGNNKKEEDYMAEEKTGKKWGGQVPGTRRWGERKEEAEVGGRAYIMMLRGRVATSSTLIQLGTMPGVRSVGYLSPGSYP
jgi:hypothetical protein